MGIQDEGYVPKKDPTYDLDLQGVCNGDPG